MNEDRIGECLNNAYYEGHFTEADSYMMLLTEKALFGSMASQYKKLTKQMNDLDKVLSRMNTKGKITPELQKLVDAYEDAAEEMKAMLNDPNTQNAFTQIDDNTGMFGRDKGRLGGKKSGMTSTKFQYTEASDMDAKNLQFIKSQMSKFGATAQKFAAATKNLSTAGVHTKSDTLKKIAKAAGPILTTTGVVLNVASFLVPALAPVATLTRSVGLALNSGNAAVGATKSLAKGDYMGAAGKGIGAVSQAVLAGKGFSNLAHAGWQGSIDKMQAQHDKMFGKKTPMPAQADAQVIKEPQKPAVTQANKDFTAATNQNIAKMQPGQEVVRSDGTVVKLTQQDIDYSKNALEPKTVTQAVQQAKAPAATQAVQTPSGSAAAPQVAQQVAPQPTQAEVQQATQKIAAAEAPVQPKGTEAIKHVDSTGTTKIVKQSVPDPRKYTYNGDGSVTVEAGEKGSMPYTKNTYVKTEPDGFHLPDAEYYKAYDPDNFARDQLGAWADVKQYGDGPAYLEDKLGNVCKLQYKAGETPEQFLARLGKTAHFHNGDCGAYLDISDDGKQLIVDASHLGGEPKNYNIALASN